MINNDLEYKIVKPNLALPTFREVLDAVQSFTE